MTLTAAVASVVVTPPVGVELCGYGHYRERRSTGVRDDLRARALVLRAGEETVVLVNCDLIGLSPETVAATRALIQERTGIAGERVVLTYTHTHSGPSPAFLRAWGEVEPSYLAVLPRYLAGAVQMAAATEAAPVTPRFGRVPLPGFAVNRCEAGGPVDEDLSLLRLDREDGRPLALLSLFAAHCVVHRHTNTGISRDYPGAAAGVIEAAYPGSTFFFLQGACGDINPALLHTGKVREAGTQFAGAVLQAAESAAPVEAGPLRLAGRTIGLPVVLPAAGAVGAKAPPYPAAGRKPDAEPAEVGWRRFYDDWEARTLERLAAGPAPTMPCELQALRLGDVLLSCNPCELFTRHSLAIQARSPFAKTCVVGYANAMLGYMPDQQDLDRDGYAATLVPRILDNFAFAPEAGPLLVDESVALLGRVNESMGQ